MSYRITRYTPEWQSLWDAFVEESKNATFLFKRRYMDYHADRFVDHSLMFFNDSSQLVAILPANEVRSDQKFITHAGLTYGGLLLSKSSSTAEVCYLFEALITYLKEEGFAEFIYKAIPHIYHRLPAEEDLYALWQVGKAQLLERKVSATLDLTHRLPIRERRQRYIRAAKRKGIQIEQSTCFADYWQILRNTLGRKYGAKPVHTLDEIERLHRLFPENIHLLLSKWNDQTLSGAVLFVTDQVVHAQYLCSSPEGDEQHSNELMVDYILEHYGQHRYFDFGTSADEGPLGINPTLLAAKESYGCRAIMYDTYVIKL